MKSSLTSRLFLWSISFLLVSAIENGTEVRVLEDNCTLASEERNTTDISYYCGNASGLLSIVNKCPTTKEEWNVTSSAVDCQNETTYHCLIDNVGKLRHGCLMINWYKAGHCPFYSIQTEEIMWIKCGVCPDFNYPFYTIYKYKECVTPIEVPATEESSMVTAVILIIVFILVIIGITIVGVRRRQIRESVFVASFSDRIRRENPNLNGEQTDYTLSHVNGEWTPKPYVNTRLENHMETRYEQERNDCDLDNTI